MANGTKGCEFGRASRMKLDDTIIDVNNMGKKLDKIFTLLLTTLVSMIGSVVVGCVVFYMTRGQK